MAEAKVTKRDNFNAIIEVLKDAGKDNLVAVIEHEIELLDKKKTGKKSETKTRKANKVLDERIMDVLESADAPMSATAVMNATDYSGIDGIDNLTLPKVTNRLTYLCKDAKRVDRIADKNGVTFAVGTGKGAKEKEA